MTIREITITLASVALTGDGGGVTGFSINGQAIADVVSLPRATAVQVFGRGNAAMQIQFTALREFATTALLEKFVLAHFGTLAKSGALVITAGSVAHTGTSAAVTSVQFGEPMGLLLPVTYSIVSSPLFAAS